jgi:RNase P/RNase MRP subunit POP5
VPRIVKGIRRHRYIDFDCVCEEQNPIITKSELIQTLRQHISSLSSKNFKEPTLWVVRFDGTRGILKCHYKEKEHAIQLLQSLKKIGIKPVTITTHSTSGTIRGLADKKHTSF